MWQTIKDIVIGLDMIGFLIAKWGLGIWAIGQALDATQFADKSFYLACMWVVLSIKPPLPDSWRLPPDG